MKINILFVLVTLALGSLSSPLAVNAQSNSAVFSVSSLRAQGREGAIAQVNVYPYATGSTVINFRPTGEKVRQVSLGGSPLLLSSDDPDCLSSTSKRSSEACAATLIYLQQKPPGQMTAHPGKTRMTVSTDKNLYLFEVVLTSGTPKYTVVEIQPNQPRDRSTLTSIEQIAVLNRGFLVATKKKYLLNPELNHRIRNFLSLAQTEPSLSQAASQAGVSMDVVRKLEQLGRQTPATSSSTPTNYESLNFTTEQEFSPLPIGENSKVSRERNKTVFFEKVTNPSPLPPIPFPIPSNPFPK
ncbi:MAG: hypothetical protein HC820_04030 [Hydrococcus sp. RM1_1_31]|nr:hypothetical protein [Hydrococcus sp. RM1_1_31]